MNGHHLGGEYSRAFDATGRMVRLRPLNDEYADLPATLLRPVRRASRVRGPAAGRLRPIAQITGR
jgi:hypothetical protein